MKNHATALALAASAAYVADVNAHVYLTQPLAEFKAGASKSSWVAEFQPPWSGEFKTGAQYAAVAPGKGYKDLRSFLEDKGPTCGNSLPNASPKPIPSDGTIKLASTIEHAGPCEVWLDNTRAFHNDDCEKAFGSATSFKMDFSACKGSCMLRFYWLGLQDGGKRWQSYKNCIPLGGSGGGSSNKGNSNSGNNGNSSSNKNKNNSNNNKNKNSGNEADDNKNGGNRNQNNGGNGDSKTKKPKTSTPPKTTKPSKKSSKNATKARSADDEYSFADLQEWQN